MDVNSAITIVVVIAVVYFIIKVVISPLIRAIIGIFAFLVIIYLLQKFGFDIDKFLSPLGISLNISKWGPGFDWVLWPVNYCVNNITNLINAIFKK